MADIPGLIAGAAEGAGLGTRFLGHVERCGVLLHLIDGTEEDVRASYRVIRRELEAYGTVLGQKQEVIGLNKTDALSEAETAEKLAALRAESGAEVLPLSGGLDLGVTEVLRCLMGHIRARRNLEDDGQGGGATDPADPETQRFAALLENDPRDYLHEDE